MLSSWDIHTNTAKTPWDRKEVYRCIPCSGSWEKQKLSEDWREDGIGLNKQHTWGISTLQMVMVQIIYYTSVITKKSACHMSIISKEVEHSKGSKYPRDRNLIVLQRSSNKSYRTNRVRDNEEIWKLFNGQVRTGSSCGAVYTSVHTSWTTKLTYKIFVFPNDYSHSCKQWKGTFRFRLSDIQCQIFI